MVFSEATRLRAKEIIARYPADRPRSALLALLHLVQSEEGFVSPAGIAFCADVLGLTKAEVTAVATFYTMYKRRPAGDWLVSVCTNAMCDMLGGRQVYQALSGHLGVGHDETTADGLMTLEHAECLAACDYAPVMTVNYEFFDRVDEQTALDVVDRLRKGERPMPTRGARLCPLSEVSRQLAGYPDDRAEALADTVAGAPTVRGVSLAERFGVAAPPYDPATTIGAVAKPAAGPAAAEETAPQSSKPGSDRNPAGDSPSPQAKGPRPEPEPKEAP